MSGLHPAAGAAEGQTMSELTTVGLQCTWCHHFYERAFLLPEEAQWLQLVVRHGGLCDGCYTVQDQGRDMLL